MNACDGLRTDMPESEICIICVPHKKVIAPTSLFAYKLLLLYAWKSDNPLKPDIMERFINPFSDFGFKKIFGQEVSKGLLISFLNSLLEGEKEITDISYMNPDLLPEIADGRGTIYDVYCTTTDDEPIIVEMQYKEQENFRERSLYYLSRAIAAQGEKGSNWRFKVNAVYGVFFMNFCFRETSKFRTDVILADRDTGELFCDKLRQVFLELPRFTKSEAECETNFDRWIYTLKNMETLKNMPFRPYMAVFEQLEQITDIASMSKEERQRYDESIKVYRDNLAVLEFAKKEGERKGKEEGRAEGKVEGKAEATHAIAANLKRAGASVDIISRATGLTPEEISAL